jgi:hypothetical protein
MSVSLPFREWLSLAFDAPDAAGAGHDAGISAPGHDAGIPDAGHDAGIPDAGADAGMADAGADAGMSPFAFESGVYAISNARLASSNDECGLLGVYTDPMKEIGISVSGTTVTLNLSNDPFATPVSLPTATLDSNMLTVLTEANYTVAWDAPVTCVTRVRRSIVGEVLVDNTADLTLSYVVTKEFGCAENSTAFAALPCASSYRFTATKK